MASSRRLKLLAKTKPSVEKQTNPIDFKHSIKLGDYSYLNFDKLTNNLESISFYNKIDESKTIPNTKLFLKLTDVVLKSTNEIGGILAITNTNSNTFKNLDSKKEDDMSGILDDKPDAISFLVLELLYKINNESKVKTNMAKPMYDNELKEPNIIFIPFLVFENSYIKVQDILGILYSNIDSFWIIVKNSYDETGNSFRLLYYYKNSNCDYIYTDIFIDYAFIGAIHSTFYISPSIVFIIVHDKDKNVIILNYTIKYLVIDSIFEPCIYEYGKDITLFEQGKYVNFLVNYNISMFTIILEMPDNKNCFYSGILSVTNPNKNNRITITLDFTEKTILLPNTTLLQANYTIYTIMCKTEQDINKFVKIENDKRKEEALKQKVIKEKEIKDKEIENNIKKLLEEEESLKKKKEKAKKANEKAKEKAILKKIEEARVKEAAKAIEEARAKAIEEARAKAIEEARAKAIEEARAKAIEEDKARAKAIEEARAKAIEEAKAIEISEIIKIVLDKVVEMIDNKPSDVITNIPNTLPNLCNENIINPYNETYYYFDYYLSLINPQFTNALRVAPTTEIFVDMLFQNRHIVMNAIDNLVINHPYIINIKKIMDSKNYKKNNTMAIYGSYLTIIYSFILNEIGYKCKAFTKYEKPLDEVDCDTMSINIIDSYDNSYNENENSIFVYDETVAIDYHTDTKPIQRTVINTSSIHNLLQNCWDINYTSALLLYEKDKIPYILKHPDFTDFLFGLQPIQLLYGKNESNLYYYDYEIQNSYTIKKTGCPTKIRLEKAKAKWL